MMKQAGQWALTLVISGLAQAQFTFQATEVDFGYCATDQVHAVQVQVENSGSSVLTADQITCVPDWCLASPAQLTLQPGESSLLSLSANVAHNIQYEGRLILEGDWGATSLPLYLSGDYPGSTWDSTFNLSGNALKSQLNSIVSGHNALSYTGAREEMFEDLDNENGWVETVYTGYDIQTWGIPDHTVVNTEHTWPQSYGAEGDARSDLHHLFPCKSEINSSRGNLPFGEVVNSSSGYPQGGADRGTNSLGYTVFEPRDQHKGDCARAVFYFALRYGNLEGYLSLTNQEDVLRTWHGTDAVSTKETNRNNGIAQVQQNRNPFIDQPGLLDRLANLTGNADLSLQPQLSTYPAAIDLDCSLFADCGNEFVLANAGTGALSISQIFSSNPDLQISVPSLPILLGAGEGSGISFTTSSASGSAVVSIQSNGGSVQLPVSWAGEPQPFLPPVVSIQFEGNGYRLTWDAVPGASSYRVQYTNQALPTWLNLGLTSQTQYFLAGTAWSSPSFLRVTSIGD